MYWVIKAARLNYIQSIARKSGYALELRIGGEFDTLLRKQPSGSKDWQTLYRLRSWRRSAGRCTPQPERTTRHTKIVRENGFEHVGEKWRSVEHPAPI